MKKIEKEKIQDYQILLASQSPRRRELIQLIEPNVRFLSADVDETVPAGLLPEQIVQVLAEKKARAAQEMMTKEDQENTFIIGCDTIVSLDGTVYGKPQDEADAVRMLGELSGKTHQVYTGVSILYGSGYEINFAEKTDVTFKDLDEETILNYVETGEPLDKAGAYGIQGKGQELIESFEGDYDNVIGLPVYRLGKILRTLEEE